MGLLRGKMIKNILKYLFCVLLVQSTCSSLFAGADAEELELTPQVLDEHTKRAPNPKDTQTISYSPDGKIIASGDPKGFINLLSVQGYLLRAWPAPGVHGVKFSNSGKLLASVDTSSSLILWDPNNGKQVDKFDLPEVRAYGNFMMDFNPNDTLVVLYGYNTLTIWDIAKHEVVLTVPVMDKPVDRWHDIKSVYFADSGRAIVTKTDDKVKIWDLRGNLKKELQVKGLIDISVYRAGREIICSAPDTVSIFDVDGKLLSSFPVVLDARAPVSYAAYLSNLDAILTMNFGGFKAWTRQGRLLWDYPHKFSGSVSLGGQSFSAGMQVSPDGKSVAMRACDVAVKVWDTAPMAAKEFYLRPTATINDFALFQGDIVISSKIFEKTGKIRSGIDGEAIYMAVSPDGSMLAATDQDGYVKLFNKDLSLVNTFPGNLRKGSYSRTPLSFSPDSKRLALAVDTAINIREVATGRILTEIPFAEISESTEPIRYAREVQFMPDGKNMLVGLSNGKLYLVNVGTRKSLMIPVNMAVRELNSAIITKRGTFGLDEGNSLRFWDAKGHELPAIRLIRPIWYTDLILHIATDPGNTLLALGRTYGGLTILDFTTGKVVKELPSHLSTITGLKFSADGSRLFSSSVDGVLKIWDTKNWNNVTMLATVDNEWLIYTPDGYFDASPHGGELVAMVDGLKAYGIEQFAARNNRPDLILERMGLGTEAEISNYQMQYQKRLKKLGLTESMLSGELHVPEAVITKASHKGKFVNMDFSLSDGKYQLKSYNIFVNNVPLFGPAGRAIHGSTLTATENIELTSGKNKIELSVMNEAGAESYRAMTYAEYEDKAKRDLYYLAFGVSKYKDAALALGYADKDAKDLGAAVSKMSPAYTNVHTREFLNSEVTAENIKKAKDFLKSAGVDDTVILFVAGHGGYDKGKDPKYYYLPYEADLNDLAGTGVAFEEIEDLLNGIKPRKKLFLLDTCESGELDEDIYTQYYTLASARGFKPRTFRKPVKARGTAAAAGRGYLLEKDRFIYNDLARRSGAIVFSSSRGNEISYESSSIQNGFFSREIINALSQKAADLNKNGKLSIDELKAYVSKAVSADTVSLQNPTIDRDNLSQKIELPLFVN